MKLFTNKTKQRAKALESITNNRLTQIDDFFFNVLPELHGKAIPLIKNGEPNLFRLPSGKLPKFNYFLPTEMVYVYVASSIEVEDIGVADTYGYTYEDWIAARTDLETLPELMKQVYAVGNTNKNNAVLWIIKWEDPIDPLLLVNKYQKLRNG